MFKITEKGRMILTRGDSCDFSIDLYNEDGTIFIPGLNDTVLFSIKNHIYDEEPLISKEGIMIELVSSDTKDLDIGTYYYDIKILFENGEVQTVLPTNYFVLESNIGEWNGEN